MRAAWLWARSRLRQRWRSLLVIALLAGIGSGVAMTAAAGSVRASSGWQRFRADTAAPNALFTPSPDHPPALLARARRIPGVTASGAFVYTPVRPGHLPAELPTSIDEVGAFVALDDGLGRSVYRPRILSGRRPDPARADEVTVNEALAELAGLEAGDRVPLEMGWAGTPIEQLGTVTVVGIHVGQYDVGVTGGQPNMLLPRAFGRAHEGELVTGGQPAVMVRLSRGDAGLPHFERELQEIYGGGIVVVRAEQDQAVVVDAVNVQRVGLGLLALAAALATSVAAVQAIGRVLGSERADLATLRSLGMRRQDVAMAGAGLMALAGALAAAIATTGAVLASRLVPSGTAGELEPPGLRLEPGVLAAGVMLIVVALATAGGILAARDSSASRSTRSQPAPMAGPLAVRLGVHWTFSRSPGVAASGAARAALTAVVVGIAGITAVVTFAVSLDHLGSTHRLYGWDFDGGFNSEDLDREGLAQAMAGLTEDERITGLAWGSSINVPVNGSGIELYALDQARGFVHPSVIEGRAPVGADEIALGTESLAKVGAAIGSTVRVGEGRGVTFRVVGRAVYPELGNSADLANAGSLTVDGLARLDTEPVGAFGLVRVRDGLDVEAVLGDHPADGVFPGAPFLASRVRNIQGVGALPWLLAGFLAVLGLTAVGHALALSVRARRRELAVLRSLGAVRGQLASAVWAQATLTVVIGSLVGLPVGVAAGRWTWGLVADGLGVLNSPVVAWPLLGGLLVGTVAIANLLATGPAVVAARLHPATVLRSE